MSTKGLTAGLAPPLAGRRALPRTPEVLPDLRGPTQPATQVIPPGMLMPFAGPNTSVPSGWLLCDGQSVSRAQYPDLFNAIGYTYGGSPGPTFIIPNLKGRVIVGYDAGDASFNVLGVTGGAKTHTLVVGEVPGHSHQYGHTHGTSNANTNHAHNVYSTGGVNTGYVSSWHKHAMQHWHYAWTASFLWNGTQTHGHHDRGGTASEGPWEGANWTGGTTVNVDGTAQAAPGGTNTTGDPDANHQHGFGHDHPSTNYASESPWPGNYDHNHPTNSQNTSTTDNGTGGAGAHNNLQPYMAMNYLIKT